MKLTLAKIAAFMSATGEFVSGQEVNGYSIDSRTVGPGQLFFAVKGERLDGHDFVEQALEKGAASAVVGRINWGVIPGKQRQRQSYSRWKTLWLRYRHWPPPCGRCGANR